MIHERAGDIDRNAAAAAFEPRIDPDIGFVVQPQHDFDLDVVPGKLIGFLSRQIQNQTS